MGNRFMSRIMVAVCLLAMFIPFAIPVSATEPDRYGYRLLTNDAQRAAYRTIAEGISTLSDSIDLSNLEITKADVDFAASMVCSDYPEYFWYSGAYFLSITNSMYGDKVNALVPAFHPNGLDDLEEGYGIGGILIDKNSTEFAAAKSAFQAAVNTALAQIPAGSSDYKKTEILHDYLAGIVTYESNPDDQTAYGALVQGKAVCAGYTRAYQILLNKVGIPSFYVAGNARIHDDHLMPHAWNLLWLDGNCYYTDVTWDDQVTRVDHRYFNLSLEQMQTEHIADNPLPAACGHTQYTYHKQNTAPGSGICEMNGSETGSDITPYFKVQSRSDTELVYTCNIYCPGVDFNQWANAHPELIQALGITGQYTFGLEFTEFECWVTITETISSSGDTTQTPNGSTEVTPQPDIPPVGMQPSVQPTPTPTQSSQEQQPTEQTVPATQPVTPPSTQEPADPTLETEPTVPQGTEDPTICPAVVPTQPAETDAPGNQTGSVIIAISVCVVIVAAGAGAFVLIKQKH